MIPPGQTFWAVAPAESEREERAPLLGRRFDSIRNIEFHPRDATPPTTEWDRRKKEEKTGHCTARVRGVPEERERERERELSVAFIAIFACGALHLEEEGRRRT